MGYNIIEEKDFEKARKKIREAKIKREKVAFISSDDELNRKILEKEKIDILLLKQAGRKDFSKQRDSGFNQVMAKAAKKTGTSIGIFLDEILAAKGKEKSRVLARIRQNIKLCNKNRVNMEFITLTPGKGREIRDLGALGLILGMPTWMIKTL